MRNEIHSMPNSSTLAIALRAAYLSLGLGFAALISYGLAAFLEYWPTHTLSVLFCLSACILNALAALVFEIKFRAWQVNGIFWQATLVQTLAAIAVAPLVNWNFLLLGVSIVLYFLGVYFVHDGMREVRMRLGLKTDLNSKEPVANANYDPRINNQWIHGLVVVECLIYATGSYIFANRLAGLLKMDSFDPNGYPHASQEVNLANLKSNSGISDSVYDFLGFLLTVLAGVALAYFYTGREAVFNDSERKIYVVLLTVSGAVYLLSRFLTYKRLLTKLTILSISMTLLVFWGSLASDRLERDLDSRSNLSFSPSYNWSIETSTSSIVEGAATVAQHFPIERPEIASMVDDYIQQDLEDLESVDVAPNQELLTRMQDLKNTIANFPDLVTSETADRVEAFYFSHIAARSAKRETRIVHE